MIEKFLLTRGKDWDYQYLGSPPKETPWVQWSQEISFEEGAIFIKIYNDQLVAFITGIRSQRRDKVNTPIRYSLAFQGAASSEEKDTFLNILEQWFIGWEVKYEQKLQDANLRTNNELRLTECLDSCFQESIVGLREESNDAIRNHLDLMFKQFSKGNDMIEAHGENKSKYNKWVGNIYYQQSRENFIHHVRIMLDSKNSSCVAMYLNSLGNRKEVEDVLKRRSFHKDYANIAILVNALPDILKDPQELTFSNQEKASLEKEHKKKILLLILLLVIIPRLRHLI